MKKLLTIIFTIVFVISLSACSELENIDLSSLEPINIEKNSNNNSSVTVSQDASSNLETVNIDEILLVDESDIKITAKSLSYDSLMGTELKLLIENNSDSNLTIQCRNSSVNGYMIDSMMSVDVASGKKANDSITFLDSDLDLCDIDTIADIEFSFHIFYTDSWDTYLDTNIISLKTSAADDFEYKFDDSGEIAYDQENVKIVIKGLSENTSLLGPEIVVYIENNSTENITVQTRELSINGFMIDPIFSTDVMSNKKAISSITFLSSDLEDNDITKFETLELSFHIFNLDTWNAITDTDTITLNF